MARRQDDPIRSRIGRRDLMHGAASFVTLAAVSAPGGLRPAHAAGSGEGTSAALMQRAQAMLEKAVAAGDQAFGAVVVKDGRVVGEGPSRVVTNGDPTAHAEMEAIRDAARRLGTRNLSGCQIYSTTRPCRMCETAAYWASLDRMVFGSGMTDGGAPRYESC